MFRALRVARCGKIALWIAGFLAVCGSFGLHPEPPAVQASLLAHSAPGWHGNAAGDGNATHGCLACLAHRSVSVTGLTGVVLRPASSSGAPALPRVSPPISLEARPHDGRAPPALS